MAIKGAASRIKAKAYGYSSEKTPAAERIKARATGVGGQSYYTIDKWQKDNQSAIDTINSYNQLMNSGGWMSNEDRQKYKNAIDAYTATATSLRNLSKNLGTTYSDEDEKKWLDSLVSLSNSYTSANELYSSFADADQFTNWWNYNTGKNEYHSVTGAEDYLQNSQYVKGGQDSRYDFINQGKGYSVPIAGMGADDLVAGFTSWLPDPARDAIGSALGYSEPLPDVDYSEFISDFFTGLVKGTPNAATYTNNGDLELTDEEIGVYNYYYATQGKEKADEYLKYIEEEVRQRKAGIDYANFKAADNLMDALLKVNTGNLGEYAYGFGAGVESGLAGFANVGALVNGTEGYTPASQYVSSMIRNDLGEESKKVTLEQVFYDLANTTGNMAPSRVVGGALGPGAGSLAMGLSAAGNNYTSFLKENYGVDAARAYGIITGISEFGMSYMFSGIGKLGGKVTSKLAGNIAAGLNNAAARIAVDFAKSFVGEAFEEAAQSALEPVFKWAATLGEAELEAINWEEVGYSALLGGLSGGMLEGAPSLLNTAVQSHAAYTDAGGSTIGGVVNALINPDVDFTEYVTQNAQNVTDTAVDYANELESIDPGNKAAQYVLKKAEAGKNISGYQVNRLANEINSTNQESVKSAVKTRLVELGEGAMANKVADVITKVQLGQAITAAEEAILNTSKNAYLVLTESDVGNIKGGGLANKWSESILKNLDSKNGGKKVETPIAVRPEDEETESVNAENSGKRVEAVETIAADKLAGNKINQEASEAMAKGYDGNMPADDYSTLYQAAYDAGKNGKAQSVLSGLINLGLSQKTAFAAYEIGRNSVLKSDTESGIINTENAEAKNESGEGVHLRGSVQRNNGKNTEGQLSRVEKDSGKTEGRRDSSRSRADEEAARLVHEGREVVVADLGIPGGSKSQKIYRLEGVEDTAKMKKARKAAEKRGLVVRFFAGDNLMIETKDGTIENVRGYIQGKYVYIRADHPYYTADQIMRHELGHDMVAKGEVSIKKVIKRLTELVGEENVEAVLEHYAAAYGGTTLNKEEIWEEIVCDSLGDMNIFAGDKVISEFMAPMLKDIKQATKETKGEANKTRGAPEGKASREIRNSSGSKYLTYNFNGFVDVDYTNVYVSDEDLAVIAHAVKTGWGRINPEKTLGGVFTANDYYVFRYNKDHSITLLNRFNLNTQSTTIDMITEAVNYARIRENEVANFGEWINSVRDGGRISFADYTNAGRETGEARRTSNVDDRARNRNPSGDNRTSNRDSYKQGKSSRVKEILFDDEGNEVSRKYSRELDTDDYSQILNKRTELNKVQEDIKSIEKSDDFNAIMDKISDSPDDGINAYLEWKQTSGYGDLLAKRDKLEAEVNQLSKAYEDNRVNGALNAEQEAIKKSGLSEADYFRKEAEKEFGYTPYYYDAGYILPNGKMLNFSGEKGKHFGTRGEDHRAIGIIYADTQGSKALTRFMNDGNIRIMAESPGLDIASNVEPSSQQYATIKDFIYDYAKKQYFNIDLSDDNGRVIGSLEYEGKINATRIINDLKHYYETGEIRGQSEVDKFRFSRELDTDRVSYAPTFYSHMGKVIDEIKLEKMGASGVVSYLTGRGVKAEEIKWSGIEAFLAGKKSVTKAELQEFVDGSQLQIEESATKPTGATLQKIDNGIYEISLNNRDDSKIRLYENGRGVWLDDHTGADWESPEAALKHYQGQWSRISGETKWSDYKLDGGSNYREIVFKMPNSTYSNPAMKTHWGDDAEGIIAHARIQDMTTSDGKKMLFVEEIQSDWHNEGHNKGYASKLSPTEELKLQKLREEKKRLFEEMRRIAKEDGQSEEFDRVYDEEHRIGQEIERMVGTENSIPDAPFRNNYHEYVLKRLLRMAAEEGYDSIGWTTADIQSKRWSDEYAEGYRIEYDQDIPKFLRKYGKKWGATVGTSTVSGTEVWSMTIPGSMKDSVLYEGQPQYSRELDLIDYINEQGDERVEIDGTPLTNRELLANALETAAQSEEELEVLKEYKKNIKELNKKAYVLSKMKEDIKRLSFAKGQKDTAKINELKEKAKKVEGSINYYDRQLTKLEAMKPVKDLIQRERSKAYKAAAEKGRQALKRNVEGRHKSETRAKIKALKEKFMSMLEYPTDRQYVPSGLVDAMVEVCKMIDTSTSLLKSDGSINKAQQARNEQMQRLINLAAEYKKIKNNPDAMVAEEYDEEIAEYLDEIVANYASKNIADMTLDELTELYRTMKAIEETLRDARKLIGWTEAESVYDAGDSIIAEQRGIAATRKQNLVSKADDIVVNMSLAPMRAVLRMAGYNEDSALYRAFREIEKGVREQKKFVMDAVKKFEALTTGKNADVYEKAIYDPYGKELVDKNGKKFYVTKMQMMQAIMSYEREMANDKLHHVSKGGFTFADINLLGKGEIREAVSAKNAHTVTLGAELALKFQMELANDQWAQDYMAEARKFFDETAKDAINEANMKLKHRIIATGKNYIPYEVNSDYIVREITSENDIQQVISGYGMLKDLKEGASQPIIITGLNNVLDRHIEQVGNVAALAVPIRNFNKIWNVTATDRSTTVKEAISNNWGIRGTDLITQAVKDVQGSRKQSAYKWVKQLKSNLIGATFTANVSVVLKQIGSMFSATSMLNWRDPVSMIGNLFATKANRDAIAAEVNKYTAVAWVRGQGLSEAELYELKTAKKKSKISRAVDKLPNAVKATSWITQMDYDVALSLWKYAKEDVAKSTGLEGEELLQATAEYYNDVIENTQSMSDALHRPEIQKKDDIVSETLGIFKTDLYQNAGLLRVAVENVKANPGKESNKALVKALGGTFMSMCWGSLITSLMAALRYKVDRYRDDEDDEITVESWSKAVATDMAEEMVGYLIPLFGSEAAEIVSAVVNGESYEFDNLMLSAINDLVKAMTSVGATFKEEDFFSEKAGKAWKNLLIKAAAMFRVPANNAVRFIEAVKKHAQDIANGEFLSFEAGLTSKNPTRLYNAYLEGDPDKIEKASRLYEDEKAVNEALRQQLREKDPRMQQIAQCELLGDTKRRDALKQEIVAEGHFDKDEVVGKAVTGEINYVKNKIKEAKAYADEDKTAEAQAIYKALIKRGYTQAFIDAYLKKIN